MMYLRSVLFYVCVVIMTFLLAAVIVFMRIFGQHAAIQTAKLWGVFSNFLLRYICNITMKVEGQENIPAEPCVVVAKHQSTWETTALPLFLPPFAWVLKKELMYVPFFGWALQAMGAIGIKRSNPRQALKQVSELGTKTLQDGRSVVIFPEGTRTAVGEVGNYQPSAFMLAKKAGVAILPVAHNAGVCWPKGQILKHQGTITIRFLPCISAAEVKEQKRNDLLAGCAADIEAACRELGA